MPHGAARLRAGAHAEALSAPHLAQCRPGRDLLLMVSLALHGLPAHRGKPAVCPLLLARVMLTGLQTLFRVWDVFMVDGVDVLFRVAFAILRINEQELLRCTSIPAVYVALESLPNRMWEADRLLQVSLLGSSGPVESRKWLTDVTFPGGGRAA